MFYESECLGDRPEAVEVTPTCVYVRRGFREFEQEEDGEPTGVTGWRYSEARMGLAEYAAWSAGELGERADLMEAALVELAEIVGGE